MLETSRDLSRQLQLKTLIIENFVSPQLIEKVRNSCSALLVVVLNGTVAQIRNRIEYDEDTGTCKVNPPDFEALNLYGHSPRRNCYIHTLSIQGSETTRIRRPWADPSLV